MADIVKSYLFLANADFATAQVLIGLGLLVGRWAVQPALAASFAWTLVVWWFGEGFGMLAMGMASVLTGAPGPVLLYALVGLMVWPVARTEERSAAARGSSAIRGSRPSSPTASSWRWRPSAIPLWGRAIHHFAAGTARPFWRGRVALLAGAICTHADPVGTQAEHAFGVVWAIEDQRGALLAAVNWSTAGASEAPSRRARRRCRRRDLGAPIFAVRPHRLPTVSLERGAKSPERFRARAKE
jgi:hypothetical protein